MIRLAPGSQPIASMPPRRLARKSGAFFIWACRARASSWSQIHDTWGSLTQDAARRGGRHFDAVVPDVSALEKALFPDGFDDDDDEALASVVVRGGLSNVP